MEIKKMKRTLSLILVMLMIISALPINVLAENREIEFEKEKPVNELKAVSIGARGTPRPNWEESEEAADTGGDFWPLAQGVRTIYGQNGGNPLNSYGASYSGHYLTDDGRVAIRGKIIQRQVARNMWSHFVMRFPDKLYNKIDWDRSYVTFVRDELNGVKFIRFADNTLPGPRKNTKSFPYEQSGATYGTYYFHIILKEKDNEGNLITWDNAFKDKNEIIKNEIIKNEIIQIRLFNNDGKFIFSGSKARDSKYTINTYGAYTKTITIPVKSNLPKDWVMSTTASMFNSTIDAFNSSDTILQIDKENNLVRLVYLKCNRLMKNDYENWGEVLGLRQSFDKNFIKYLDLSNKDAEIATIRAYDFNEKDPKKEIKVLASDINGVAKDNRGQIIMEGQGEDQTPKLNRTDQSVFIQLVTNSWKSVENERLGSSHPDYINVIRQPKGEGNNFNWNGLSREANMLVFEYKIDPKRINDEMIQNDEFIKNFFFDTRYILDNNKGMKKFTYTLTDDLVVTGGLDTFFKIHLPSGKPVTGIALEGKRQDILLNIGGLEGYSKSWKRNGALEEEEGTKWYNYIPLYGTDQDVKAPAHIKDYGKDTFRPIGYTFKKGQEITILVPTDVDGITNAESVTFEVSNGRGTNSQTIPNTKFTLQAEKDIVYNPMYIENTVSTIGGTAYRVKFPPIVDEIFTDGKDIDGNVKDSFTGYNKYMEGYVTSEVFMEDTSETTTRTGIYNFSSESNDKGEITKYFVKDGTLPVVNNVEQYDEAKESDLVKTVDLYGHTYTGFAFDIKKQYNPTDENYETSVKELNLLKDTPVVFKSSNKANLDSDPVVEQVQARITFKLDGGNEGEAKNEIVKIAPLNTEYPIHPTNFTNKAGAVTVTAGQKNTNYKPSGFLAAEGADNLRIDKTNPTVKVDGKTYPNFLDHSDSPYDITKQEGKEAFMMRQWPEPEMKGKEKVIGWTTVKLVDQPNGKTAEEQFEELASKRLGENTEAGYIRSLEDWKKADKEAMIFDQTSPIDKHRTVYAVYGIEGEIGQPVQKYYEKEDERVIEGTTTDLKDRTVVILVDENGSPINDSKGNPIKGIVRNNRYSFDITNLDDETKARLHNTAVYVKAEDRTEMSNLSATLDLKAPTLTLDLEPDLFKYKVKVTGNVSDADSDILHVKYTLKDGTEMTETLNVKNGVINQDLELLGKAMKITAEATDAMGNKTKIVTKPVEALKKELTFNFRRARAGQGFIFVKSTPGGADLVITITNNGEEKKMEGLTLEGDDYNKIELIDSSTNEAYKLQKGDRIRIQASKTGYEDAVLNSRIR